ncbi:MAG: penicillin-binding protein [Candidatus Marinimicrobia bacterium]|nr:penicillin-binding protein [Candidatus Neomarinimicrobiota bacterium]
MNRLYSIYGGRIRFVSFSMLACSVLILSRMFFIQSFQSSIYREAAITEAKMERSVKGKRGDITDRNGNKLAETIHTYTFWVNTQKEFDKQGIVSLFAKELQVPAEKTALTLSVQKPYVSLAKGLLRSECEGILAVIKDIQGLHMDVSLSRFYPFDNLASQVVGYTDRDHNGQFGIERHFDPILSGKTSRLVFDRAANGRIRESLNTEQEIIRNGVNIELTLDVEIQAILLDALKQGLKRSRAVTAYGVIINPFTGDILAMASVPDFNPNEYWNYDVSTFSNRIISDSYEPGSTFKLISMTAILESDIFNDQHKVFCENGEYQIIPSKVIHDHEPHKDLSISEIFIHSSNIGLSKLVDEMGAHHIYDFSRRFGFGMKTGVPLTGETSGRLRNFPEWTRLSGPSIAMGQEISVNTLQLALAYAAAANGGYLPAARIIKQISGEGFDERDFSPKPIRRVMSEETSRQLLAMMEDVVVKGTAHKARIPGFRIGGKTGTAEKFIDGKYSKREFISSFASIFPMDKPKYVCVVSVDSPMYGYHWGNETAAPIVKEIFERLIIINNDKMTEPRRRTPQFAHDKHAETPTTLLSTAGIVASNEGAVPNFLGKTLKQSVQEAKSLGIQINPVGTSGRVVWQSVSPGQLVTDNLACTIKLETM